MTETDKLDKNKTLSHTESQNNVLIYQDIIPRKIRRRKEDNESISKHEYGFGNIKSFVLNCLNSKILYEKGTEFVNHRLSLFTYLAQMRIINLLKWSVFDRN